MEQVVLEEKSLAQSFDDFASKYIEVLQNNHHQPEKSSLPFTKHLESIKNYISISLGGVSERTGNLQQVKPTPSTAILVFDLLKSFTTETYDEEDLKKN